MKKPDRFERSVKNLPTDCEAGLWENDVVKLLRHEHAWMRRMLEKLLKECKAANKRTALWGENTTAYGWKCRAAQCTQILDKLEQRRK